MLCHLFNKRRDQTRDNVNHGVMAELTIERINATHLRRNGGNMRDVTSRLSRGMTLRGRKQHHLYLP